MQGMIQQCPTWVYNLAIQVVQGTAATKEKQLSGKETEAYHTITVTQMSVLWQHMYTQMMMFKTSHMLGLGWSSIGRELTHVPEALGLSPSTVENLVMHTGNSALRVWRPGEPKFITLGCTART